MGYGTNAITTAGKLFAIPVNVSEAYYLVSKKERRKPELALEVCQTDK